MPEFVSGAVEETLQARTGHTLPTPAFIWPEDRTWCITLDVDPHWAVIGANPAAIDAVLTEQRLDIVPLEPGEEPSFYF